MLARFSFDADLFCFVCSFDCSGVGVCLVWLICGGRFVLFSCLFC